MIQYILWVFFLLLNNGSNTAIARARTSRSLKYHAIVVFIAAIGWLCNQLFLVNYLVEVWQKHDIKMFLFVAVFFTFFTVVGSVSVHWFLMKYVEKAEPNYEKDKNYIESCS